MRRCLTLACIIFASLFASVSAAWAADRPNILWITSEDNGVSWIGCYGGVNSKTPAIDQLAKEGFRYTHCFDNAAVCAPTRSTWITGMYAISLGTQPMRSRNAIPHDIVSYYPDLLKQAGYFATNGGKTDYNIGGRDDDECWDPGRGSRAWRKRKTGQRFFSIVNIGESHESRAHGDNTNTKNDPESMKLYSYHPDLPAIRRTYAKYADAVERMDAVVGKTIEQLKEDGLYEDTIVVYCSDHGGVLPRSKRFLYSSGIHCPMVVRIPEKWKQWWPAEKPGMTVDRIVSFVDMPKTWLSLAGAEIPETFQGSIFLGDDIQPEPKHHLGFRERADERLDHVRMIRDKQFAYYKNYYPFAPAGQHLAYLWKAQATPAWEQHHREGNTDDVTGRFFRARVSEEFYDTVDDFDNVKNLIDEPAHQKKIADLRSAMRQKQLELFDSGLLPEQMRTRRAKEHDLTIYEMVRDAKVYPLETYLDAADMALLRDKANLQKLTQQMSDEDEGMRWWASVGLHLLEKDAAPSIDVLKKALTDESHEIRMMAAWTLVKIGEDTEAMASLRELLFDGTNNQTMLENVLDWMGEPALPLIEDYVKKGRAKKGKYGIGIFQRIAEVEGW